jgi:hypothetical protein
MCSFTNLHKRMSLICNKQNFIYTKIMTFTGFFLWRRWGSAAIFSLGRSAGLKIRLSSLDVENYALRRKLGPRSLAVPSPSEVLLVRQPNSKWLKFRGRWRTCHHVLECWALIGQFSDTHIVCYFYSFTKQLARNTLDKLSKWITWLKSNDSPLQPISYDLIWSRICQNKQWYSKLGQN